MCVADIVKNKATVVYQPPVVATTYREDHTEILTTITGRTVLSSPTTTPTDTTVIGVSQSLRSL